MCQAGGRGPPQPRPAAMMPLAPARASAIDSGGVAGGRPVGERSAGGHRVSGGDGVRSKPFSL
jgi:hypothetical protein